MSGALFFLSSDHAGEHGSMCMVYDIFRDTPAEEVSQTDSAMGCHGNHVGSDTFGEVNDATLFSEVVVCV